MDADRAPPVVWRFAGFTLDLARGALLGEDGAEIALRPKAFSLLRLLVENAGRLLDRDAIMAAAWPDVVVGDESITQCVYDIRRALGDEGQLLRTVPKRGYLLAAEVMPVEAAPRPERRLAAILAADIVGYSRLIEADEASTLAAIKGLREQVIDPLLAEHKGRIVKLMGDGALVEFASVVDAVACAVAVQKAVADRQAKTPAERRIVFRIGVNLGDVVVDGDDLLGDGVNVAARLEQLCEPGGVLVSGTAYDHLQGRLGMPLEFTGEQQVKNIARSVRAYRVRLDAAPDGGAPSRPFPSLPNKPSIAVLPFQNMSGDPEQEYFADGIVEEIITALSRMRWLFVIARNSSFTYKGRNVDLKQVGRDLGVRYLLEGSVRKASSRVRITGQLIDAGTGAHLWAERFDGALEDIFELQDRVAASVVGAIAPRLEQAEIVRAKHNSTDSLDAYDAYLRGVASIHAVYGGCQEATNEALQMFYRAIDLDPDFAAAHGMAAWCYVLRSNYGWTTDRTRETAETERLARQATRLAGDDAVALYTGGFALARVAGYLDDGAALIARALELDPNSAAAWHLSGWVNIYVGKPEIAIDHMTRGMRLNPLDPLIFGMQNGIAAAHFLAGRYDEATAWSAKALQAHTTFLPALRMNAASHACAGRPEEAQRAIARVRVTDPELRVSQIADVVPFRGPQDIARYLEGLRKAGLPD